MTATLPESATPPAPPLTRRGGRTRETLIFLAAIALIALHVIDDNFLQPQPGTSPGDHLVSGLVPLALLGLAAWAYPRLRGGRRGALALFLGPLGIATGIEAFHYTRELGASGDDFTGLLAIPAGLVLIGLGAVTLWRTRRTEGSLWWRYPRRALLAVAGAARRDDGRLPGRPRLRHHARRARRRAAGPPRRRAREREVRDQRRARARGLVRPVEERRRRDRVPRSQRPAGARRGCSPATATACCCSTAAARARARASPTPGAGAAARTSRPRSSSSSAGPTSTRTGSARIGLSVGGEMLIETAAETDELAAVVSEGAGARSTTEDMDQDDPAAGEMDARPRCCPRPRPPRSPSPPTSCRRRT